MRSGRRAPRPHAPDELDPDATGDAVFEDPETGDSRRPYFGRSMADRYRRRLETHVDAVSDRAAARLDASGGGRRAASVTRREW